MTLAERRGGAADLARSTAAGRPAPPAAPLSFRLRYPLLRVMACSALAGAFLGVAITSLVAPTRHTAAAYLMVLRAEGQQGVTVPNARLQVLSSLARSNRFAQELARQSGRPDQADRIADALATERPDLGGVMRLTLTSTDQELVEQVGPNLLTAFDATLDGVRSDIRNGGLANFRDLTPDDVRGDTGPLYLAPYGRTAVISQTGPPLVKNAIVGMVVGLFLALVVTLGLNGTARLNLAEANDTLSRIPLAGTVPRLGRFRGRRRTADYLAGLSLALHERARRARRFAVLGCGLTRETAAVALALAAGFTAVEERSVVLVDAATDGRWLSRRLRRDPRHWRPQRGLMDLTSDRQGDPLAELSRRVRPLPLLACPPGTWSLVRAARQRLFVLPVGRGRGELQQAVLAEVVNHLSETAIVVVVGGRAPGRVPVRTVAETADLCVAVALDGWSPLAETDIVVGMLNDAVPRRSTLVVLEN